MRGNWLDVLAMLPPAGGPARPLAQTPGIGQPAADAAREALTQVAQGVRDFLASDPPFFFNYPASLAGQAGGGPGALEHMSLWRLGRLLEDTSARWPDVVPPDVPVVWQAMAGVPLGTPLPPDLEARARALPLPWRPLHVWEGVEHLPHPPAVDVDPIRGLDRWTDPRQGPDLHPVEHVLSSALFPLTALRLPDAIVNPQGVRLHPAAIPTLDSLWGRTWRSFLRGALPPRSAWDPAAPGFAGGELPPWDPWPAWPPR
jgi:hypothetical protein